MNLQKVIRLNLTTAVTLGTEESDRCREVQIRVNVWTFQQKSSRCGEVAGSEGLTEYRSFIVRCLQTFYKHLKVDYYHNYLVKRLCKCQFFFKDKFAVSLCRYLTVT